MAHNYIMHYIIIQPINSILETWHISNINCWTPCGKVGGLCESVCGSNGFCCINSLTADNNGDCPVAAINQLIQYVNEQNPKDYGHICAKNTGLSVWKRT